MYYTYIIYYICTLYYTYNIHIKYIHNIHSLSVHGINYANGYFFKFALIFSKSKQICSYNKVQFMSSTMPSGES